MEAGLAVMLRTQPGQLVTVPVCCAPARGAGHPRDIRKSTPIGPAEGEVTRTAPADLPALFVHEPMMPAAQQEEIVEPRRATIRPMLQVVRIGEAVAAAGEAASAIALAASRCVATASAPPKEAASMAAVALVGWVGASVATYAVMMEANPPPALLAWAVVGTITAGRCMAGAVNVYHDCTLPT